uniref:Uncharacterized protein n=1 Tax=Arion vulgaris TaxID=1028688 RepID=A0A0B6ZX60_9EUPU
MSGDSINLNRIPPGVLHSLPLETKQSAIITTRCNLHTVISTHTKPYNHLY